MTAGNVREELAQRISGGVSRSRRSAQVRYTGFPDGKHESGMRTKTGKRRTKGILTPSGSHFQFRQKAGGPKSQWISVSSPEDIEFFEESENYEVRRE